MKVEEINDVRSILKKSIFKYNFIYKTTNLINGKIYVGQHRTDNLEDGYIGRGIRRKINNNKRGGFHNAVFKYGYDNFKREILEFCCINNIDEREEYWINFLDSSNRKIGYNLTKKAGGGYINEETYLKLSKLYKGRKLSVEQKEKISVANKGKSRPNTETQKLKISIANTGKVRSENIKIKISNTLKNKYASLELIHPMKGRKHSEESKMKNRLAHLGKKASKETKEKISVAGKGRVMSEENKKKLIESNLGRIVSDETRLKISNSWNNRKELICPYCGLKNKNSGNMNKFHFENCKHK